MQLITDVDAAGYTFDVAALEAESRERWPAQFVPATGLAAQTSAGYLVFADAQGEPDAMRVHLPLDGKLLQIESGDAALVAELAAWLTSRPGFPADSHVALFEWANDGVPLRRGTTAADLLAAKG